MVNDCFGEYLAEINRALGRGDATEHTHRLMNHLSMTPAS